VIERISQSGGTPPRVFGVATARPKTSRAAFGAVLERAARGTERGLEGSEAEDHVFTQIDSAVVVAKQPRAPFGKGIGGLDPFLGKPEGCGTREAALETGEVL